MKKFNYIIVLSILSVLLMASALKAQVTIGSGTPPVQGALLQLKENDNPAENASKGLMLPRVELSDINNLFPMFADSDNPNSPNADYANPTYKDEQDKLHTGLIVYNMNQCAPFGKGVFLWDGQKWYPLSKTVPEGYSTIALLPDTLHIPSGADKRAWIPVTMSFDYNSSASPIWSNLQATPPFDGLVFADQTAQISPYPALWSASPAIFSVKADMMTSPLITKMHPWATRQSSVMISSGASACGSGTTKTVLLNQTNYAISGRLPDSANNSTDENDIASMITIRDANPKTMKVLSNTRWQASVQPTGGSISEVLSGYTEILQGQLLSDGNFAESSFSYTGVGSIPNTQFKYITVNLKDVYNRAEDFPVTIMQCQGNEDLSSVTTNATPAQTSDPLSDWGDKVVRHQAKNNFYEGFYSADFGTAGRWMITNLAATNYDTDVTPYGFTSLINSMDGSLSSGSILQGYYTYPHNSLTAYNNNPYLGLLYNFAGATAGDKAPVTHDEANDQSPGYTQGICPNGWHVPSDYEWTQLENEIINNTTKYAYVAKNIIDDGGQLVPPTILGGTYRGTHAPAMTNACETYTGNVQGTSRRLSEGGFGAYFAGEILNGAPNDFGETATYWTSSSAYSTTVTNGAAYYRVMSTGIGDIGISAFSSSRKIYMAVRCKRD